MMRTRLPDLLAVMAGTRGDHRALTDESATLTYAELWAEVCRVAGGLRRLGVARGDRVAVFLDKRIDTVTALLASSAAGGIVVPINPLLRPGQVAHILLDCQARLLVTSAGRLALLRDTLAGCTSVEQLIVLGTAAADAQAHYQVTGWEQLRAAPPAAGVMPGLIDADAAAILYTSGSTGPPRGVVLSHRNLVAGAESVAHYLQHSPEDVILAALPFSFDAGLSQLTTGMHAGAEVVLMNYLLPSDVVRLCAKHRVTGLTCVPPLWIQLAEQPWSAQATRHLRYFANTGGQLPKATLDRLRSVFSNAQPFLMYGLTEAFRSTYLDPAEVDRRPASIGKAIPNAEVLVVRPDGSPCHPGEQGELVHRGATVAMGYWNQPAHTAARFRPPPGRPGSPPTGEIAVWSGDIVVQDEEGFLYFVGRTDEMIKTSGYRVSPTEIEQAAYDTGLIRDAVALGRADTRLGQHIILVVTAPEDGTLDRRQLRSQLRNRLPRYMAPQQIVVWAEFPRTPNGKFDRTRISAELAA